VSCLQYVNGCCFESGIIVVWDGWVVHFKQPQQRFTVQIWIPQSSPDVICIVESWLDYTIADSEIFIQGYSIVRLDRSRHGGGVLIFVNNQFTCAPFTKAHLILNASLSLLIIQLVLALTSQLPFFIDHLVLTMLFWIICFLLCVTVLYQAPRDYFWLVILI